MIRRISTSALRNGATKMFSKPISGTLKYNRYNVSIGIRFKSDTMGNITYSGGQASEGQGGFYGSGGSRIQAEKVVEKRPEMLALAADVQHIVSVMNEVDKLEGILERENEECGDSAPSGKSIELRGSIKKVMADPKVIECLDRLEVQGEPVWGLSSSERDLIQMARQKVNDC